MKQYELSQVEHFEFDTHRTAKVQARSVSDGYHTMDELYDHRRELSRVMLEMADNHGMQVWKAKKHFDGTMFDGYFVVGMMLNHQQISYHYDLKYWDSFHIPEYEICPVEYDGHSSNDVLERLARW